MDNEDVIRRRAEQQKNPNRHWNKQGGQSMQSDLSRLVPVQPQEIPGTGMVPTVNARLLHAALGSRQHFADWIQKRINKTGFERNHDYVVFHQPLGNPGGGRPASEYHVSLDMAKHLAMLEQTPTGMRVRRYFIECEQRLQAEPRIVFDPDNLPTHLETAQALVIAITERDKLRAENAALAPRAAVADAIADASGLLTWQQVGNELGFGRTTLLNKLKAMGIIQRNGQPMRRHIERGRFEVKNTVIRKGDRDENYAQVFVTGAGLTWLSRLLNVPIQGNLLDDSHADSRPLN